MSEPEFELVEDDSLIQATVLNAALGGDPDCLGRLPALVAAFDEPYRSAAAEVACRAERGHYVDGPVLQAALEGRRLGRPPGGGPEPVDAAELVRLITRAEVRPGQARAYLTVLEARLAERRRREVRERLRETFERFGDDPDRLSEEVRRAAGWPGPAGDADADRYPSELLELL